MASRAFCKVCMVSATSGWLTGEQLELVCFADHRPLPSDAVGEPPGQYWFCSRHVEDARALAKEDSTTAVEQLAQQFGPSPDAIRDVVQIWIDDLGGADRVLVLKCIRAATGAAPAEVTASLRELPAFVVAYDWRNDSEEGLLEMKLELERLGVKVRLEEV